MYKLWVTMEDYVCAVDSYDYDYDDERDFVDEHGDTITFMSYDGAIDWINRKIKPEKIHPSDKKPKFRREDYLL